jgi:hypothetical protein
MIQLSSRGVDETIKNVCEGVVEGQRGAWRTKATKKSK